MCGLFSQRQMESNYLHGKLGNKKPMKPKPYRLDKLPSFSSSSGGTTIPGNGNGTGTQQNQEIKNLEKDIEILKRKFSDISHIPLENSKNIQLPIIPGARPQDEKLKLFDEFFTRIITLDREVLRITSEDIPRLARRNSKPSADSLGSDLFHLPTHLILLDRLLDFHTQLKRENALKEGREGSRGGGGSRGGRDEGGNQASPQIFALLAENDSLKKQLEDLTKDSFERFSHLQRSHEKLSQDHLQLQQKFNQQFSREKLLNENLQKEFEDEKRLWREQETRLRQEVQELKGQKNVLEEQHLQRQHEWEEKWQQNQQQQEEREKQQMQVPPVLLTSDGQYTDEATREIFLLKKEIQQLKEQSQQRDGDVSQYQRVVKESLEMIHESQLVNGDDQRQQQIHEEGDGEDNNESYKVCLLPPPSLPSSFPLSSPPLTF
jgi:hypothetical protein